MRASYHAAYRDKKAPTRNIQAEYRVENVGPESFDGSADFKLLVADRDGKIVLRIECSFEAHFHVHSPDGDIADRFAKAEMRIIFWPYFRQFVADLTARMHIPVVTIPLSTESAA